MNTVIKSLTLAAALVVGSFAGPSLDFTLDRHANVARLTDENIGPGKTVAGAKLTLGDYTAKLDGLGENLRFTHPTLTVGVASSFLGMDRLVATWDEQVLGLGVVKEITVNRMVDMEIGAGLQRDKNSGMKSIPQGTAHLGLSVHVL
jgi:hypothetical protein